MTAPAEPNAKSPKVIPGENLVAALFTVLFLALAGAIGAYYYFNTKSPFKSVNIVPAGNGVVNVEVTSVVPLKNKIEYGTSQVYLNETPASSEFSTSYSQTVGGLLSGKEHFLRVVGVSQDGRVYTSSFYKF